MKIDVASRSFCSFSFIWQHDLLTGQDSVTLSLHKSLTGFPKSHRMSSAPRLYSSAVKNPIPLRLKICSESRFSPHSARSSNQIAGGGQPVTTFSNRRLIFEIVLSTLSRIETELSEEFVQSRKPLLDCWKRLHFVSLSKSDRFAPLLLIDMAASSETGSTADGKLEYLETSQGRIRGRQRGTSSLKTSGTESRPRRIIWKAGKSQGNYSNTFQGQCQCPWQYRQPNQSSGERYCKIYSLKWANDRQSEECLYFWVKQYAYLMVSFPALF